MMEPKMVIKDKYFKLNNDVNSKEPLVRFIQSFGFTLMDKREDHEEYAQRTFFFTDGNGFDFSICWYRNLSYMRIGKWGKTLIDVSFDCIREAWIPYQGHTTLSFECEGKSVAKFAIVKQEG